MNGVLRGTCSSSSSSSSCHSSRNIFVGALLLAASCCSSSTPSCYAFSASASSSSSWKDGGATSPDVQQHTQHNNNNNENNILILDHINMNHEKGRHDWLKAFYVDFLQCALDPRKIENVELGRKTIWCNIGAQQFHLPEGKPGAQVLDGIITLVYPNLDAVWNRYDYSTSSKSD